VPLARAQGTGQAGPSHKGRRRMTQSTLHSDNRAMSFEPMTPLSFLDRAASVHLAGGAPVAVLAPNTHVLLEAHFAVPSSGSPLVAINTRLAAPEIRYILEHSGAAILLVDPSLGDLARDAVATMLTPPVIVAAGSGDDGAYQRFIADANPTAIVPADERALLTINYTSGTTGRPKGVMYHHRGAYLQALAMLAHTKMDTTSAFLWTLPMFHCNGWCFPRAVTAAGATHVCLPKVDPDAVWDLVFAHSVTHLCGAPAVLSTMVNASQATASRSHGTVQFIIGGAAPSPALLTAAHRADIAVIQAYGLTETHGPALLCDPNPDWQALGADERFRLQARQGVANYVGVGARVIGTNGADVPADGATVGEVCLRGNTMMLGYFKDEEATTAAARMAGFAPAIWLSCIRTTTSNSGTARRTSSFPVARTSPPSKWNRRSKATPPFWRSPSWAHRTSGGEKYPSPMSGYTPIRMPVNKKSSITSVPDSPGSKHPNG
jgi:fatty-acyl-CoA synthase